jgi:PAS domain S-box-containing protein
MDKNILINSLKPEEIQNLYIDLVETSQDLIWQCDAQGRLIYLNPAWEVTLGYSIDEMIGKPFSKFQTPEIAERDLKEFTRILAGGTVKGYETIYLSKLGEEINLVFNSKVVVNKKGDMIGTRGTAYDITDRMLTVKELQKSENQYKSLFQNLNVSFSLYDVVYDEKGKPYDYRIIAVNPMYEKAVGMKASLLIGKTLLEAYPTTEPTWIETMNSTVEMGTPFTIDNYASEVDKWIEITVYIPEIGQLAMIASDITERKQAEEKLLSTEAELRRILNISPAIICSADANTGYFVETNSAMSEILGFNHEELTSKPFMEFVHPEDVQRTNDEIAEQLEGSSVAYFQNRYICKDDSYKWLDWQATNIDETGKAYAVATDITERKLAEQKLSETDERHSAMLANIGDVIGIVDANGIMTYKSPNIEKWFGWKPEERTGVKAWDTVHPKDINIVQKAFHKVLEKEDGQVKFECRYKCKDGTYSWIELTAINCISNPTINGILINYHDITERKSAETALKWSMELLNETGAMAHVGGWEIDLEISELTWTDEVRRIHEVPMDYKPDLATAIDFYTPESQPVITASVNALIERGEPFDLSLEITTAKRNSRWIRAIGKGIFADGKVVKVSGAFQDITEHRKAELALSAEKERLAVTLRSIGESVITTDSDGKIIMLNNAAEEMTGWNSDDAVGRPLLEVLNIIDELTETQFGNLVEDVITTGDTVSLANHIWLTAKDGGETITALSGAPLLDDEGKGIGVVLVFRDMTEEENAQAEQEKLTEQLHQSQKMDAVGQLAGGIAHDFNNALGGIIGAADILLSGDLDKAQQKEFLDMIILAADRAGDLTKKLLLFSRKEKKTSSTIDMTKIVNDTVDLLGHVIDKNISISIENSAINTSINGDDSLLQNAIMNMAINASYAMPEGGTLTFMLENLALDAEYCAVSPFKIEPGDYVSISVRDSGCGMSPETQSHIFEPFYTTKEQGKGTGLGLATAYGTVQDHSGAITVYSELGSGTVFHLYFPITEAVSDSIKDDEIVSGTGTILVIDDEEMIRITSSAQLTSLGYKVFCSENGEIGVNTFKDNRDEIDLVILDMIMPVMGGREAFGKLREIDPNIPVIISSGFSKEDDVLAMKTEGISGFLHKPFRRVELSDMVRTAIDES